MAASATTVSPGGSLNVTVTAHSGSTPVHGAQVQITGSGLTVSPASSVLGDVTSAGRTCSATIIVPGSTSPGFYTVTAAVWGAGSASATAQININVTPRTEAAPAAPQGPAAFPPPNQQQAPTTNGASSQLSLPQINPPAVAPAESIGSPPFTTLRDAKAAFSDGLHVRSIAAVEGGWLAVLVLGNGLLVLRLWVHRRPAFAPVRFVAPKQVPSRGTQLKPSPEPVEPPGPPAPSDEAGLQQPAPVEDLDLDPESPFSIPALTPSASAPNAVPPLRKALHSIGLAHKRGSHRRSAKNPVIAAVADPQSGGGPDEPVSASVRDGRMSGTGQYGPDWNGSLSAALRLLEG